MTRPVAVDPDWLQAHPLPTPPEDIDKNERGRVLLVGGSRAVPGGLRLTAEAALRAGAGKVRVATVESAAIALGVTMPEIGVFGLPEDAEGEIDRVGGGVLDRLVQHNDAIVLGPAIGSPEAAGPLVDRLVSDIRCDAPIILDAAALTCLPPNRIAALRSRCNPIVLTPHVGEMAALLQCEASDIELDRHAAVQTAAHMTGGVCLLKGSTSLVATPQGDLFTYEGGGVGLATGGSGDVLAGLVAGLIARGIEPIRSLLWAIWIHGEAGRQCAENIGVLGYLSRELLPRVPRLLNGPN